MKQKEKKDMIDLRIKTKNTPLVILIFFLISLGCKNNQEKSSYLKTFYVKNPKVNERNVGKIIFDSELDTIKTGEKDLKSTTLFLGKFKSIHTIKELEQMHQSLDTFGFIEKRNDTIYFDYEFDKLGTFYLDGYIEEKVFLDNYYKNGKSRLITNQIKISKKVKVIEK
ncbi:hypothetical protein [Aquimarina sp. RZ0]|uniref:hypothetical protein n=1 Tax=Aquimarina sp. RZ0 TaxID=2607730 RepID=UPI001CB6FB4B|nr:hypothetical protein [Aquimarina sp. RZ0]